MSGGTITGRGLETLAALIAALTVAGVAWTSEVFGNGEEWRVDVSGA